MLPELMVSLGTQWVLFGGAQIHDSMGYMEPPRQFQPVRHCLGWVLLQLGQPDWAMKVRAISAAALRLLAAVWLTWYRGVVCRSVLARSWAGSAATPFC